MEMAVAIGDCSRDDADLLRRAMGSKRGVERIESVKQTLYAGMARARARRRRRPTGSTSRSCRSRTSASPRATRCASRCSSTPARGSSCTTRRRSSPGCCAPSRWASTRRSRWSRTPAGTAWRCGARTSRGRVHADWSWCNGRRARRPGWTPAWPPHHEPTAVRRARPRPDHHPPPRRRTTPSASGSTASAGSAPTLRRGSWRPATSARSPTCSTCPDEPGSTPVSSRRWPPPVPSRLRDSGVGRRCGTPGSPSRPTSSRAPPRSSQLRGCPG